MPQPLPTRTTTWPESVQAHLIAELPPDCEWMAPHIKRRAERGVETYGTYLGLGNPGRDSDEDLRDELLDAVVYAHESWLKTGLMRYRVIRDNTMRSLNMLGE